MESGTHNELWALNGVYARLVRRQLKKKSSVLDADDSEEEEEVADASGANSNSRSRRVSIVGSVSVAEARTSADL